MLHVVVVVVMVPWSPMQTYLRLVVGVRVHHGDDATFERMNGKARPRVRIAVVLLVNESQVNGVA